MRCQMRSLQHSYYNKGLNRERCEASLTGVQYVFDGGTSEPLQNSLTELLPILPSTLTSILLNTNGFNLRSHGNGKVQITTKSEILSKSYRIWDFIEGSSMRLFRRSFEWRLILVAFKCSASNVLQTPPDIEHQGSAYKELNSCFRQMQDPIRF